MYWDSFLYNIKYHISRRLPRYEVGCFRFQHDSATKKKDTWKTDTGNAAAGHSDFSCLQIEEMGVGRFPFGNWYFHLSFRVLPNRHRPFSETIGGSAAKIAASQKNTCLLERIPVAYILSLVYFISL